jgi:hypothetical protein
MSKVSTRSLLPPVIILTASTLVAGCSEAPFPTPLESAESEVLTSYEDMMGFLGGLQTETEAFTLDTIGHSVEGRALIVLRFEASGEGRPEGTERLKVLIYAQQHGNEPSGKEAAIALARDIANGAFTGLHQAVDFYLVPQVNPDGSEMGQRRNAGDMDLNRDHLPLSTPEIAALHSLYHEILPDVTLDVHEYGFAGSTWVEAGFHKNFGQQIGALSNANMSLALRKYAWDRVIPQMEEELKQKDVFLQRYLVTDGPEARFRYSTTALNDGRNSMGINHSLSFLIEGRNGLTVESDIRERARQQLETIKAFLRFFVEHATEVKDLVARERASLTGRDLSPDVALVMDYVQDPDRPTVTVGVIDLETGEERELVIEAFHPSVEATLFVPRPLGYVIPARMTSVLGVLERHGIQVQTQDVPTSATLDSYRIDAVTPSQKEDKDFLAVDVTAVRGEGSIAAGDVIVWCDQMASNLIVTLLEPQSQWGLAPLPEFADLLTEGSEYPIKRIVAVQN